MHWNALFQHSPTSAVVEQQRTFLGAETESIQFDSESVQFGAHSSPVFSTGTEQFLLIYYKYLGLRANFIILYLILYLVILFEIAGVQSQLFGLSKVQT